MSAVIADGAPRRILGLVSEGSAELVLPEDVVTELARVLTAKIGLGEGEVRGIVASLEELEPIDAPTPSAVDELSGDPDDDRILAASLGAGADVLVSGDRRHLLPLGEVTGMRIVTAKALLAELIS